MARQLSQRMTSMITGQGNPGLSKQTQQKVYSGLPDRVEIQNIFHVDVKSIDGSGAGSLGDLSDKIAQILREEALQHGIDIT
jgi:hypothetical protein